MKHLLRIITGAVGVFLVVVGVLAAFDIADFTQRTLPLVTIWVGFLMVEEAR